MHVTMILYICTYIQTEQVHVLHAFAIFSSLLENRQFE